MTASDWDEIKRLASDFHRIQLISSVQKLSERNCIEIVQKLVDLKVLEVIYTTDGKEYLTPVELSKEILEELTVAGGRINLVDLQQALNVDLSHIEEKVNGLLKSDKSLKLIVGQLINKDYFDLLGEEINDKLQQQGLVTLPELAKNYNLPGDVLKQLLQERLGTIIKGHQDDLKQDIFTTTYLNRHQSTIRGILAGIIRPTSMFPFITKFGFQEKLFYSVLDKLMVEGDLHGSLTGGRPYNVVYTPDVYIKSQEEWVTSFFNQNSYLEYDCLIRLGISNPQGFIKRKFKNEPLEFLKSCCIGTIVKERVEAEMDEALEAGTWFNVLPLLPSICTSEDAKLMVNLLTKKKLKAIVLGEDFIVSEAFIENCIQHFKPLILAKAEKNIRENPSILLHRNKQTKAAEDTSKDEVKEQRKKRPAGGKSNYGLSGPQSREVKTKAVKKKYHPHGGHKDDADEEEGGGGDHFDDGVENSRTKIDGASFMTITEICTELAKLSSLTDAPQEFVEALAILIARDLNKMYNEESKNIFLQSASVSTDGTVPNKKKLFAEVSEKIVNLWSNAKLFEKGIQHFKDDLQAFLASHLLRTICTDIVNFVFGLYATENTFALPSNRPFTSEERNKVISVVKDGKAKSILIKLNSSVNSKGLDDFFIQLESICAFEFLNIPLKRDKKKDRQFQFGHRQSLAKDLASEDDPALVLHICCILLFQTFTQSMLHASGKFVPHIISFLKGQLQNDHYQLLIQCQELIMKSIKMSFNNEVTDEEKEETSKTLGSLIPQIKELPSLLKGTNATQVDV